MNFLTEIKDIIFEFLRDLKPSALEEVLLSIGSAIGFVISAFLGAMDATIYALITLTAIDYISGTVNACKTGKWDSSVGFKGLLKKAILFGVVGLCNQIDQAMGIHTLRQMAVCAYALNEAGSIVENIDVMGFGSYIPHPVRHALARLEERVDRHENIH